MSSIAGLRDWLLPFSTQKRTKKKENGDSISFKWINHGEVWTNKGCGWGRSFRRSRRSRRSRMLKWVRWRTIDEPRCSNRRLWPGGWEEKQSFVLAFLSLASFLHNVLLTPEREIIFQLVARLLWLSFVFDVSQFKPELYGRVWNWDQQGG